MIEADVDDAAEKSSGCQDDGGGREASSVLEDDAGASLMIRVGTIREEVQF